MESYVKTAVIETDKFVPTIVKGAKNLIRCLSEAETKIDIVSEALHYRKNNYIIPHEDMATMAIKYGQSSLRKDVYKFISVQ